MRVELKWTARDHPDGFAERLDAPDRLDASGLSAWGRELLDQYNAVEAERYGNRGRPRTFVSCVSLSLPSKTHDWVKRSLTTQYGPRGGIYDAYQCSRCRITGKRFGLASTVKRDSRFRAKAFVRCDTAMKFIEQRGGLDP